jgi:hypothetical protein
MAQQTTLTLYGIYGRTQSFSAKEAIVLVPEYYPIILYIDRNRAFSLSVDQSRLKNLNVDQSKEFTMER